VRFQEPGLVRGLIVGSLKNALAEAGHRASSTVSTAALGVFNRSANTPINPRFSQYTSRHISTLPPSASKLKEAAYEFQKPSESDSLASSSEETVDPHTGVIEDYLQFPLGAAKTQLHATYIVSQNKNSIIITDQHAAHERLVYEKMKKALQNDGIKRQILLIPEIVDLEESKLTRLLEQQIDFGKFGFSIDEFGPGALIVREVPSLLGDADIQTLIRDLADDLEDMGASTTLEDKLGQICGTLACYGSVRAGRSLNIEEMNALLREMENTPHSGQCNHGRPTYIELNLTDVERLFGRR
jgi:DNA mismatch repair protein MutL